VIRVLLAEDHPIMRQGLQRVIDQAGDMVVAGEACDGRQALLMAESVEWDVLVLDLSLPRVEGIEVLRRLRELRPGARIVVLSVYPEEQFALRALCLGAAGYLCKECPPEDLLTAIRKVHAGGMYVTDTVAELSLSRSRGDGSAHAQLSAREHQVFTLLSQGRSVSEIAAELDLRVSTVSNHVQRIKQKLGARTIGEIVGYAHRAGLVP
jgi:DNA-binding NarL/FixJ family response regulator